MKIEVLGPRASGKTTICKTLSNELTLEYVSLGSLSRKEIAAETLLGNKMKYYVDNGIPYPDGLLVDFMYSHLKQALEKSEGFVLDGYPRRATEAKELFQILNQLGTTLNACIELDASVDELLKRAKERFWCPSCDNQISISVQKEGQLYCPECATLMVKRSDDTPEEIKRMYKLYLKESDEVKKILLAQASLEILSIDANRSISIVTQSALFFIRSLVKKN
jgi:adenylate kinase